MIRDFAPAVLALALAAGPACAQQAAGPAAVKLSLANPALGQPAPAPGFFASLGAQLWSSARQAAGSWAPAMNFIPDRAPAPAPPALPPSLLPGAGSPMTSRLSASALPLQGPGLRSASGQGSLSSLGSPVLPGGIIPLRSSQSEPLTPLHRRALSLSAKAEALRAPLQNLADMRVVGSDAGAERASRAGGQISDIVSDDWASGSGNSGAAAPGPQAGQALGDAELASLRDAVAQPPAPAFGASAGAAAGIARTPASAGGRLKPGAAAAAFGEAMDAAATYEGQAPSPARSASAARWESRGPAPAPRLDPELLVLRVFDQLLRISRAGEASLAASLGDAFAAWSGQRPRLRRRIGPPPPPPTYALGSRGPAAGPAAMGLAEERPGFGMPARRASASSDKEPFELPESLPRSLPAPMLGALLLPLIGIALFYLREFRR